MSEPREFWIDDFLSDKADFVTCVSRAPKTHFIHVIEKSAYDALKAENERCKEIAERDGKDYSDLKAERDTYKKLYENLTKDHAVIGD